MQGTKNAFRHCTVQLDHVYTVTQANMFLSRQLDHCSMGPASQVWSWALQQPERQRFLLCHTHLPDSSVLLRLI